MDQLKKFIRSQEEHFGKSIASRRSFNQAVLQAGAKKRKSENNETSPKKRKKEEEEEEDCAICFENVKIILKKLNNPFYQRSTLASTDNRGIIQLIYAFTTLVFTT